jgi:hypothetical protein
MDVRQQLRNAIAAGDLPRVKLLVRGGASIRGIDGQLSSALNQAAFRGNVRIVEWVLADGRANILDVDRQTGFTALLSAAWVPLMPENYPNLVTIQWLLEYKGANNTDTTADGKTVWDLLLPDVLADANSIVRREGTGAAQMHVAALLRVMVLRDAPPAAIVVQMSLQHSRVVEEGAQLRAGLPAYLVQRRALLAEHTSLITPLWAIVSSYEEPPTADELWATGLGALSVVAATRMRTRTHAQPQDEARHEGSSSCCCIC